MINFDKNVALVSLNLIVNESLIRQINDGRYFSLKSTNLKRFEMYKIKRNRKYEQTVTKNSAGSRGPASSDRLEG